MSGLPTFGFGETDVFIRELMQIGNRLGKGVQIYTHSGQYRGCCLSQYVEPGRYSYWDTEPPF